MALEVGRLVARIDIEGSFEQKIAAAKTAMEDAASSASKLDEAVGRAGKSGAKLDVPAKAKTSLDQAATSASKLDQGLSKASASGKKIDVSDTARRKLDDTATSAGKTATSLDRASVSGKNMRVSDQPKVQLSETASAADQVNTKFAGLGITMKGLVATAGGAAGLGAVLTKGWDRISSIDTAQGKLRGLGHEAEGVSTIMDSALASVTGTAYGLGDAATIAANATAAGIKPGKELTKYLTMTADASAIAGVSLGEMGRILNQVQTGQSAYAGDLSQLADRGIPIYQWLADEAGVAASEIKKMASTGQISSEMLFSAIQNNIGGAAQEMGGTLVGSLANVGAAFGRLGASAIDPFKDDIMAAASGAQEFAGTMAGVVGPAASVAASALSGVAKIVGTIPTPILAATAGLVALQKTGLGASMAGAATSAMGALRGVGETIALGGMYAKDGVKANGLFAASMDGIKGAAGSMKAGLGNVVNMLGGPWMVGLAAAGAAVGDIVGSIKRASDAQDAISESASRAATAHDELASALIAANGALSDNAIAVAQSLIEESITSTSAAAEQAGGIFAGLGNWIDQTTLGYDGMKDAVNGTASAFDRARLEGRINEMQLDALREAAGGLGISMDDVSKVVQEGGPRWELLRDAIASIGPEGEDMARKLEQGKSAVDAIVASATEAEVASMALSEAFRVMADESASAEDKTNALKAALDALAGKQMTVDEAMFNYYETIDKVSEATKKMADETGLAAVRLEDGSLAFDHTSERSNMLRDSFLAMKDATLQVAGTGENMAPIWAANQAEMEKLAAQTGFTTDELWQLAEAATGFSQEKIEATVALHNGGVVLAELALISQGLADAEEGATIRVENIGDEALQYLQSVGFEAQRIEGTTDITVVAQTADANAKLQATIQASNNLDAIDPNVNVETNAEWVTHALGITAATTEGLPPGHIEITDTTDANLRRLADLGIKVNEPKNGVVTINDSDVSRARNEVNSLSRIVTTSQHRVNVSYSNPDFRGSGGSSGYADGGIRRGQVQAFANGGYRLGEISGALPDQAMLAAPQGAGGLVQWAEAETGGEAFIPLAASKRQRSRKIWAATGKLLGIDVGDIAKFANGGFNATKGLAGTPYIWGGFSPAGVDCSGLMSVAANEATGRAPYSERTSTHTMGSFLASRGFVRGMGGAGDLRIGWNNGHTAGTAPDGTKFESQTYGRGAVWGGNSRGHDMPDFNQHMHLPMEDGDDGTSSGGGSGASDTRTQRQKNIDAIVAEGQRRGLSDRDIQIALMTAEQESGIRVLANNADPASLSMPNEGIGADHDSTGIFQQRNNGAWGTLADRMDPTKSSAMFYDELEKIQGRENMALTQVAQKVQRSAYPDAYAKHESKAAQELAASKSRLSTLGTGGSSSEGDGQRVYVTNWPAGGISSGGSSSGGGGGGGGGNSGDTSVIKEGSIADVLLRAAGQDPNTMFPTGTASGKEKRFDDTKIMEKEGDIEAAKEQARIAKLKLDELKNKTNAKGERVAPSASALSAAELRASEAERKVEKLEHDLRELRRKSDEIRAHNQSIGVDVENYANGGFHGLENHRAQITSAGSWRVWGEPETGGEAYIPLASHKRARSTAILAETAKRFGYTLGAGVNLVGSALLGGGLDTGWGGPSLDEIGIDTGALKDSLGPGLNAEAERAGMQVAAVLKQFLGDVQMGVDETMRQVDDQQRNLRQQYARAMI